MKTALYIVSAIVSTILIVLWFLGIIVPINNIALIFIITVIILGYIPLFGDILFNAYIPKKR